jgi:hypothetical protein
VERALRADRTSTTPRASISDLFGVRMAVVLSNADADAGENKQTSVENALKVVCVCAVVSCCQYSLYVGA